MATIGWLATLIVVAIAAFAGGYWIGYKAGQQDAQDGIREP